LLESIRGKGGKLLPGLVSFEVKVRPGEKVFRDGVSWLVWASSSALLISPHEFIVDIGAQLQELARRKPQQLVTSAILAGVGSAVPKRRCQISEQGAVMICQCLLHHGILLAVHDAAGYGADAGTGKGAGRRRVAVVRATVLHWAISGASAVGARMPGLGGSVYEVWCVGVDLDVAGDGVVERSLAVGVVAAVRVAAQRAPLGAVDGYGGQRIGIHSPQALCALFSL
jgi:hypothetical protein